MRWTDFVFDYADDMFCCRGESEGERGCYWKVIVG